MKKKILLVDDSEAMSEILKEWLEFKGYEVITAKDGQEGVMLLKKFNNGFDLVITDFRMPGMNGIEVIRWIKQRDQVVKTILVTGDDMRLVAPVAIAAGADKVLSKPFNFQDFQKTIRKLLV